MELQLLCVCSLLSLSLSFLPSVSHTAWRPPQSRLGRTRSSCWNGNMWAQALVWGNGEYVAIDLPTRHLAGAVTPPPPPLPRLTHCPDCMQYSACRRRPVTCSRNGFEWALVSLHTYFNTHTGTLKHSVLLCVCTHTMEAIKHDFIPDLLVCFHLYNEIII